MKLMQKHGHGVDSLVTYCSSGVELKLKERTKHRKTTPESDLVKLGVTVRPENRKPPKTQGVTFCRGGVARPIQWPWMQGHPYPPSLAPLWNCWTSVT